MMSFAASLVTLVFASSSDEPADVPSWHKRRPDGERVNNDVTVQQRVEGAAFVARVCAGDEEAVAEIFRAYAADLSTFAQRYVRSNDIAREIVQDLFLWLLEHRASWTVTGTVRAYLYGAVRHRAMDYLKHAAVEHRWTQQPDSSIFAASPEWADDAVLRAEGLRALSAAIDQLPESRRTTLALRYGHDLSYAEIAAVLGTSVKAVENQLNRTLRQLEGWLGGHSGETSAE